MNNKVKTDYVFGTTNAEMTPGMPKGNMAKESEVRAISHLLKLPRPLTGSLSIARPLFSVKTKLLLIEKNIARFEYIQSAASEGGTK